MQKAYSVGPETIIVMPETTFIGRGAHIGSGCKIHPFVYIGQNAIIGDRVIIQARAFISEGPVIQNDVFIGPGVTFINDKYPPSKGMWLYESQTVVENETVIGASSTIMAGIILNQRSFIAAGSLVTKNVPPGGFAVGVPAKIFPSKEAWIDWMYKRSHINFVDFLDTNGNIIK